MALPLLRGKCAPPLSPNSKEAGATHATSPSSSSWLPPIDPWASHGSPSRPSLPLLLPQVLPLLEVLAALLWPVLKLSVGAAA